MDYSDAAVRARVRVMLQELEITDVQVKKVMKRAALMYDNDFEREHVERSIATISELGQQFDCEDVCRGPPGQMLLEILSDFKGYAENRRTLKQIQRVEPEGPYSKLDPEERIDVIHALESWMPGAILGAYFSIFVIRTRCHTFKVGDEGLDFLQAEKPATRILHEIEHHDIGKMLGDDFGDKFAMNEIVQPDGKWGLQGKGWLTGALRNKVLQHVGLPSSERPPIAAEFKECSCEMHGRDLCTECCIDYRMANEAKRVRQRGFEPDLEALRRKYESIFAKETGSMVDAIAQGRSVVAGLQVPPSAKVGGVCAQCDEALSKTNAKQCSGCKTVYYCDRECQKKHWKAHKVHCTLVSAMYKDSEVHTPLSWEELRRHYPNKVKDRILELRVVSIHDYPLRVIFDGKDREGCICCVAFYGHQPGPSFGIGQVMRWRNPHFHFFADGSCGARIEKKDDKNIWFSDT